MTGPGAGGAAAALLAAVAVGCAMALLPPLLGGLRDTEVPDPTTTPGTTQVRMRGTALWAAAAVAAALLAHLPLLPMGTLALVAWTATRLAQRARLDRATSRRRRLVVDASEAMVGELRGGQPPSRAVDRAAAVWPELAPVSRTARLGGDVPAGLRSLAGLPGATAVDRLAGAWQLCGATGSGLATALEQVLASVRAEHEVALAVRAELASARATARLLAVLPILVLVMAQGIGAHPWDFLLRSPAGQVCLFCGVGLAVTGVMWLERIADEAQR